MDNWPHAPVHQLGEAGAFMVTAGTYRKEHFFKGGQRLSLLHDHLLALALRYGWQLQAWTVFSNHYHFVALSPENPASLRQFIAHLHSDTARMCNEMDGVVGRQVWFQYWDTRLTFQKSYLARLNYVHQNPVRHGLVRVSTAYRWCSAGWFEQRATPAFYKTVLRFKIDRVNVVDDFVPA